MQSTIKYEKMKTKFNLSLISKYRNELFGLSIISIMIFHYCLRVRQNCSGTVLNIANVYDNLISSVGVECFLFLSGMGLYFSMKKNSKIGRFYSKRMTRVLIPYAIWGGVFWIAMDLLAKKSGLLDFVLDFSFVTFWTEGESVLWYICFIVLMYLAFPLIFKAFESPKHGFLYFCIMLVFSVGTALSLKILLPDTYEHTEIAVNRIPIFLIGAYMGKRIYRKDDFRFCDMLVVLLGIAVHIYGVLQRCGIIPIDVSFSRYEFALFSISLIYICVWILSKIRFFKVKKFLTSVGALSLELYMTHVTIDNLLRFCGIPTYKIENYIVIVIFSTIFSILLHFSLKNITIK